MEHFCLLGPVIRCYDPFDPQGNSMRWYHSHPHLTEEETDAQRNKAMCPGSHSQGVVEQGVAGSLTLGVKLCDCDFWANQALSTFMALLSLTPSAEAGNQDEEVGRLLPPSSKD